MKTIKNEINKFVLRLFNKPKYYELRTRLRFEESKNRLSNDFSKKINDIANAIKNKPVLNFKHSGHMGDLMYALPTIKKIAETKTCNLFINLDVPFNGYYHKHPSGSKLMTKRSYEMLLPLLKKQSYLSKIEIYMNQPIDVDLDLFRELPCSNHFHSCRWYFQLTGIQADLSIPYLEDIEPHERIKNKIVLVRTQRAQNPYLDYSFLKEENDLLFLGTKNEYEVMKQTLPNLEFYDTKDFLELAQIIKGCKFYISNQTFAYSIAEGLKVNRILEAHVDFPVVFPIGGNGKDVYFQEHFEESFREFKSKF